MNMDKFFTIWCNINMDCVIKKLNCMESIGELYRSTNCSYHIDIANIDVVWIINICNKKQN